jgi:hypothetical protein
MAAASDSVSPSWGFLFLLVLQLQVLWMSLMFYATPMVLCSDLAQHELSKSCTPGNLAERQETLT